MIKDPLNVVTAEKFINDVDAIKKDFRARVLLYRWAPLVCRSASLMGNQATKSAGARDFLLS